MCSWRASLRPARWYDLLICVCRDTASTSFARPIIRARRPSKPSRPGCSRSCELSLNVRTGECNLLPPTRVNLPDIDLYSTDEDNPINDFHGSKPSGAWPRFPSDAETLYCFQAGNRWRRITALYDTRLVRIQSIRRVKSIAVVRGRNRVARIERQYFAT